MTEIPTKPKIATIKTIARSVVGYSVSGVVVTLIHQNTTTFNKSQKIQLFVGAYVIGTMVADKARDWTDQRVDDIVEIVTSSKNLKDEIT